jgi:hypothetical protein
MPIEDKVNTALSADLVIVARSVTDFHDARYLCRDQIPTFRTKRLLMILQHESFG